MEKSIYLKGNGDKLVYKENYPMLINQYLEQEYEVFRNNVYGHDGIIEVGCMNARLLPFAKTEQELYYIGVDIVPRYIELAKKEIEKEGYEHKGEAYCLDARELAKINSISEFIISKKIVKPFIVFPFNSFGNIISNVEDVFKALFELKFDFLISTYNNSQISLVERKQYYYNSGLEVEVKQDNEKVLFFSKEGFYSASYNKEWFEQQFDKIGVKFEVVNCGKVGVCYKGDF